MNASRPNRFWRFPSALWSKIDRFGLQPIIAFFSVSMALLFIWIANGVGDGDFVAFDRAILLAFRDPADSAKPLGPAWVTQSVIDISALGGMTLTTLLTLAAAGFLILRRRWRQIAVLLIVITGSAALSSFLKLWFHRERPAVALHLVDVWSASFPSGHAITAATLYLTLGAMLAETQPSRPVRIYILSFAVALTTMIGFTRVYLGVHWPSDIIGGWCAGAACAMAFFIFTAKDARVISKPPD